MDERTPDERRFAERIEAAYRSTPAADPAARERLDRALEEQPRPRRRLRRALAWPPWRRASRRREPWTLTVTLATAIPALVVVLAIGILLGRMTVPSRPQQGASAPESGSTVEFVVVAPAASRVAVVGDWNGWDPAATPMSRHAGTWTARVSLPAGRHVYAFVVDGRRWENDPHAPLDPANAFGFRNSVILVEPQPS
jgi:hypothetical protein